MANGGAPSGADFSAMLSRLESISASQTQLKSALVATEQRQRESEQRVDACLDAIVALARSGGTSQLVPFVKAFLALVRAAPSSSVCGQLSTRIDQPLSDFLCSQYKDRFTPLLAEQTLFSPADFDFLVVRTLIRHLVQHYSDKTALWQGSLPIQERTFGLSSSSLRETSANAVGAAFDKIMSAASFAFFTDQFLSWFSSIFSVMPDRSAIPSVSSLSAGIFPSRAHANIIRDRLLSVR